MLASKLLSAAGGTEQIFSDDVFSSFVYTGNGSTQTITNGIDLAGKGGLVWVKPRDTATDNRHSLTTQSYGGWLDTSSAYGAPGSMNRNYSSTGFSTSGAGLDSESGKNYVSWTFRKAAKFFDIVTWTGDGAVGRYITHALGATVGMAIVKRVDYTPTTDWYVYHRSLTSGNPPYPNYLLLNSTTTSNTQGGNLFGSPFADTSSFYIGSSINASGGSYVALVFAHDTSAEGIIQCGSYTGNGSATGPVVSLGWEPQYLMVKRATGGTEYWQVVDNMRGFTADGTVSVLYPNVSNAENANLTSVCAVNALGFQLKTTSAAFNASGSDYIYLAIRRPNKPPTSGTQVYNAIAYTGNGASAREISGAGFPPDLCVGYPGRTGGGFGHQWYDRLRGATGLRSAFNLAEVSRTPEGTMTQNGFLVDGGTGFMNSNTDSNINHFFRRAPGVFDVVCYTGDVGGYSRLVQHSLGVVPGMIVLKERNAANQSWGVGHHDGSSYRYFSYSGLNSNGASNGSTDLATTGMTASVFAPAWVTANGGNLNATTYVAYIWATKAGISKVGSYTGNGSSQTIDMGFSTGARFFLVKASSTTGSWWLYDSARGIVAAADAALQLNSTAAEVTSADAVDPASVGIAVNQEATCSINANGVSYVYLALA